MDNSRIIVRTMPPKLPREAPVPDIYWSGIIYSLKFDGKRLVIVFDAEVRGRRPTCYFTPGNHSLFLSYFLKPGDDIRVEGIVARDGRRGLSLSLKATNEEIESRREIAVAKAERYRKKIKLLESGLAEKTVEYLLDRDDGSYQQ